MTVACLARIRLGAAAALLSLTVLAPMPAWSADCPLFPEVGDPCTIGFGPLRLRLGSGQYSFDGSTQMNGSDGFVNGYTGGTHAVPAFDLLDLGSRRFGFAFAPGMNGEVGFNRFLGYHEISAHFAFSDIGFAADAGWEIVSIDFVVEGTVQRAGMAALFLHLPGSPVYSGDAFVASGALQSGTTGFGAGFSATVSFEEDEDGNPAGEGDARVSFDRVSVVAQLRQVRALPEPGTVALLLAAGLAGGVAVRRRRRR